METTQRDKAVIQLCIKQKQYDNTMSALQNYGIEMRCLDMNVLDEILDLLNVPKDTDTPDSFCRDWLYDIFYNLPTNKIHTYPRRVKKELLSIFGGTK